MKIIDKEEVSANQMWVMEQAEKTLVFLCKSLDIELFPIIIKFGDLKEYQDGKVLALTTYLFDTELFLIEFKDSYVEHSDKKRLMDTICHELSHGIAFVIERKEYGETLWERYSNSPDQTMFVHDSQWAEIFMLTGHDPTEYLEYINEKNNIAI